MEFHGQLYVVALVPWDDKMIAIFSLYLWHTHFVLVYINVLDVVELKNRFEELGIIKIYFCLSKTFDGWNDEWEHRNKSRLSKLLGLVWLGIPYSQCLDCCHHHHHHHHSFVPSMLGSATWIQTVWVVVTIWYCTWTLTIFFSLPF